MLNRPGARGGVELLAGYATGKDLEYLRLQVCGIGDSASEMNHGLVPFGAV